VETERWTVALDEAYLWALGYEEGQPLARECATKGADVIADVIAYVEGVFSRPHDPAVSARSFIARQSGTRAAVLEMVAETRAWAEREQRILRARLAKREEAFRRAERNWLDCQPAGVSPATEEHCARVADAEEDAVAQAEEALTAHIEAWGPLEDAA
jgi:hypothetical protein